MSAAEDHDDLSVLHRLLAALASPYEAGADLGTSIKTRPPTIAATERSAERRRSAAGDRPRMAALGRREAGGHGFVMPPSSKYRFK